MNRIERRFEQVRREGRKGFIPFVTAGDPDLETSLALVLKLAALGADVIELGVPFSDPMADGPIIQRSSQRALIRGVNLSAVLELAAQARRETDVPIILFSYLNPMLRYGIEDLAHSAARAGIDGILVTDAVDDEAAEFSSTLRDSGLDLISLIAPTTTDERLETIAGTATGFLYAVARAGVTGARTDLTADAESLVRRAQKYTDLPIAVGFGIASREQIMEVWRFADAAVVGSAVVSEIEKHPGADAVIAVERLVRELLPQFAKSGTEL